MKGLHKRIRWAKEILDHASEDIGLLAGSTEGAISHYIRRRKIQVDSARTILNEIIIEKEKQRELTPCDRQ